jgi:ribosomal protein L7Ae-like RNA K-turn-binding protein
VESNSSTYIGFAQRAGKTLTGSAAAEKGMHQGKVCLLLLQDTLSASTVSHFKLLCERYRVACRVVRGEPTLGQSIGKNGIMVVGITDRGFAVTIENIIDGVKGSGSLYE